MKKQLFLILLTIFSMSGIWSFAQDTAPSPIPTKLIAPNSPVWYYNTLDSSLWVFKGQTGWLRIATNAQLQKYYWSKTQITNADTARWGLNAGHDSLTIAPGSTDYFDINYPQIFSGQKLIDSLGVINTKIAGKAPASGSANYVQVSPLSPQYGNIWMSGNIEAYAGTSFSYVGAKRIFNDKIYRVSLNSSSGLLYLGNYNETDANYEGSLRFDSNNLQFSPTTNLSAWYNLYHTGNANLPTISWDASQYKLSGVDLFGSLTTGSRTKWDGTKFVNDNSIYANSITFSGGDGTVDANNLTGENTFYHALDNSYTSDAFSNFPVDIGSGGFGLINTLIGSNYNFQLFNGYSSNDIYHRASAYIYGSKTYFPWLKFWDSGNSNLPTVPWDASQYKLSGVDLYSSLTANTLEKWDGTKHVSIPNASGYLYNDGTGNMIWIKTEPQSLSGTTPSLNASNGVNANLSISGATTLTLSNLISGTSGTIYLTNNASVYRIKIAGYTIAPASNITYDSTGILLPASSVYTHTSIGWYYNGTTVQIHKADYNTTTY